MSSRWGRRRRALSSGLAGALAVATIIAFGEGAAAAANGGSLAGQRFHGPVSRGSIDTTVGSAATAKGLLPKKGQYAFLLRLDTASTASRFRSVRSNGTRAQAKAAAISQLSTVRSAQRSVESRLPGLKGTTTVLYRTHAVMAGLAVRTNVANATALAGLPGVSAVYPITPKKPDNSYAVPFQGAPDAWAGDGSGQNLGEGVSVADIDTGLDYTHKDFGGPGTAAAYQAAHDADTVAPVDGSYNPAKFDASKSYDLVGDDYNADSTDPAIYQPNPDPNPLDCSPQYGGEGHGTHTAGTIAGYGVTSAGETYTGDYNATTVNTDHADDWEIGPGMAPKAKLISYRVFGCAGASDVISEAIDRAMDPNGDGDTSDHADVINLSLGSDFGSPDDGDAVQADLASKLGVTVSVSAGNSYDEYDVAGSPGTAQRAITVAASVDAQSITDGTVVSIAGTPTTYASQRSLGYDWSGRPDLAGTVVAPGNDDPDGCTPFGTTDRDLLSGMVAFLQWNDDQPRCASSVAGANARAAGAIGFVLGSNENSFLPASAITGDTGPDGHPEQAIPGVLMVSDGAKAISTALSAGSTVRVTGTSTASVADVDATQDDKLASFSSRGIRGAGNVKPDVAAVGATVFSALPGAGAGGQDMSGTSMAAPMVSGLAALVRGKHPGWSPEQVKADIMNTADKSLYVGGSSQPDSDRYPATRAGAGRIDAAAALANTVLAYVAEDPGAVSISFGPVAVADATTLTKHITVQNTGATGVSYTTGYLPTTTVTGVDYRVSPASVTVPAGGTASLTVTLSVPDAETLSQHQSWDPTHAVVDPDYGTPADPASGAPMDVLAEASGAVTLTPVSAATPTLRVPTYAAPRPASQMGQPSGLALSTAGSGTLPLSGEDFGYAKGDEPLFSLASGFELQATSPTAAACSGTQNADCLRVPEDVGADLQYVGSTVGADPNGDRYLYLAIATHGAHSTAAGKVEFDVYFDTDGDGQPDLVAYNTRLGDSDVFIEELVDLNQVDPATGRRGVVVDDELLPGQNYGLDTAIYDSDVLVVPIALTNDFTDPVTGEVTGHGLGHYLTGSTVRYAVRSFTSSGDLQVDAIGWGGTGDVPSIPVNVVQPALTVSDGLMPAPFLFDVDGTTATVSRDAASYVADGGQGLLMVHYQNQVGAKAQVVALNDVLSPTVSLAASAARVPWGTPVALAVAVTGRSGTPAGTVAVVDATGTTIASGQLGADGTASLSYTPTTPGAVSLQATYTPRVGEPYGSATSMAVPLTVTSVTGAVSVTSGPAVRGLPATVTVAVSHGPTAAAPTGWVRLSVAGVSLGSLPLDANGSATATYRPPTPGALLAVADYTGDARYAATSSTAVLSVSKAPAAVSLKVTKKAKARLQRGKRAKVTVRVATIGGIVATGRVTVMAGKRAVGSARLHGGRAKVKVQAPRTGKVKLRAVYPGDWTYLPGRS